MAKEKQPVEGQKETSVSTESNVLVKARVLAHCAHGKPDDVIEIDATLVDSLGGVVDASPEAVAYAESLK